MDSREQERARHFPQLARLLRTPAFRSAMSSETGHQTIIIALPEDTMGYVLARLRDAHGRGVVALADRGLFQLAVVEPASQDQIKAADEENDLLCVGDGATAAFFFEVLAMKHTMIFKAAFAAKMIDDGKMDRELLDA